MLQIMDIKRRNATHTLNILSKKTLTTTQSLHLSLASLLITAAIMVRLCSSASLQCTQQSKVVKDTFAAGCSHPVIQSIGSLVGLHAVNCA
jgi:hypothetical protein